MVSYIFGRDRFAGGMKHIFIHSLVQNKEIARNLNDKNLTVKSSGVSEDQCWHEVTQAENRNTGIPFHDFQIETKYNSLIFHYRLKEVFIILMVILQ